MENTINIVKHSGDIVAFDVEKLIKSLQRSEANEELIQQIVQQVKASLYEGITTKKIYKMAFKILKSNPGILSFFVILGSLVLFLKQARLKLFAFRLP